MLFAIYIPVQVRMQDPNPYFVKTRLSINYLGKANMVLVVCYSEDLQFKLPALISI